MCGLIFQSRDGVKGGVLIEPSKRSSWFTLLPNSGRSMRDSISKPFPALLRPSLIQLTIFCRSAAVGCRFFSGGIVPISNCSSTRSHITTLSPLEKSSPMEWSSTFPFWVSASWQSVQFASKKGVMCFLKISTSAVSGLSCASNAAKMVVGDLRYKGLKAISRALIFSQK